MEVSVIANPQAKMLRGGLRCRELSFSCVPSRYHQNKILFPRNDNVLFFGRSSSSWRKAQLRCTVKASQSQILRSSRFSRLKLRDNVRLFVGLPLDTVSDCNSVNHAKAIAAGLKALKLLGVEGVELPVWWGVAEKDAMGKYEWSGYLAVAEMVQKADLKLHVSLCFHGSQQSNIPLPKWVSQIGQTESSLYYTDRSGQQYRNCLSLAVDDLPVLDGKTPVQVYQEFCESFKSSFAPFMGSTITGISMGLGPDGELRYPSHQRLAKNVKISGPGEFQCYDKNMLNLLKQHAEETGNPMWGLGGPHDASSYNESPIFNNFFKDDFGSWESPYAEFFLTWYSNELLSHGDRLLSLATSVFDGTGVEVSGKVPLLYSWCNTRSHPSELTAGFYNTATRDGYEAVAEMFLKNSCKMILPGMDLSNEHQPLESFSSPESLLAQIRSACKKHGVEVSGQNSADSGAPGGFEQIKKNLSRGAAVDLFTYQRMGAYFFSPEHFPSFTQLVRNLNQPRMLLDDLPTAEEAAAAASVHSNLDTSVHAQAV